MKRFISLILCIVVASFASVTAFGAKEEETIPIPDRPEDIYIIDAPGVLNKRAYNNIIRKGNRLFAMTGAQVVVVIVDEDNEVELGLLAQQILERWEIGSHERNNGFVIAIDFDRGRASYAVGEGLSELFTATEVTKLITSYELGDGYAEGNYTMVVSSLYNELESSICDYYGIVYSDWDGETYSYPAGYEVEEEDNTLIYSAIGAGTLVLFFVLVIISSICHNKKMAEISGFEKEGGYSDEEENETAELSAESENIGDIEPSAENEATEEEYSRNEGEYNTDEGEYNTDVNEESYSSNGEWKYN